MPLIVETLMVTWSAGCCWSMKNQGVSVLSVFGSFLFLSLTSVPAQWAMLRSLYLTQQLLTIKSSRLVSRRLWMMSDQGQPLTFASFSSAKSVLTMNTANQGMTATDNEAQQHCPSFQSHPNICRTTDRHYCLVLAILAIDWPWPITMVGLFLSWNAGTGSCLATRVTSVIHTPSPS